jgi:cytochrome c peroxidase
MTIIGTAYNPWLLWDGHKDNQWAQALDPIEAANEQGSTRLHALHLIGKDQRYRSAYESLFGPLPDLSDFDRFPDAGGPVDYPPYRTAWEKMTPADQQTATEVFANVGKAIAAYERLILPGPSRFDTYVEAVIKGDTQTMSQTFTPAEEAGLRLFIGPGECLRCHHGPLFTDQLFHNIGVPAADESAPDLGRAQGAERVLADEFNCLSRYSDADESDCSQLQSIVPEATAHRYAFKTPTLRNVTETGPYMHAGQLGSLAEVLVHYNQAPPAPLGQTELQPLDLSEDELVHLEAFLRTLSAPPSAPSALLAPPEK